MKRVYIVCMCFMCCACAGDLRNVAADMTQDILWLRIACSFYREGEGVYARMLLQHLQEHAQHSETKRLATTVLDVVMRDEDDSHRD
jgi:hypothetical protein